ncbi:MAG TPA: hypothetical protein VF466_04115 [Candidatus Saccharimonadales bacterium]
MSNTALLEPTVPLPALVLEAAAAERAAARVTETPAQILAAWAAAGHIEPELADWPNMVGAEMERQDVAAGGHSVEYRHSLARLDIAEREANLFHQRLSALIPQPQPEPARLPELRPAAPQTEIVGTRESGVLHFARRAGALAKRIGKTMMTPVKRAHEAMPYAKVAKVTAATGMVALGATVVVGGGYIMYEGGAFVSHAVDSIVPFWNHVMHS